MVSKLSIAIIIVNMILGVLIPIVLLVYFKKKYRTSIKSFLVGCAEMFLFAMVLEQLVHSVVLGSPIGIVIQEKKQRQPFCFGNSIACNSGRSRSAYS